VFAPGRVRLRRLCTDTAPVVQVSADAIGHAHAQRRTLSAAGTPWSNAKMK
jgi:hypothetical protein